LQTRTQAVGDSSCNMDDVNTAYLLPSGLLAAFAVLAVLAVLGSVVFVARHLNPYASFVHARPKPSAHTHATYWPGLQQPLN
jgi:hypothetical protein